MSFKTTLPIKEKPPEGGFGCTTRHIVNTLYRTHTLQFLA